MKNIPFHQINDVELEHVFGPEEQFVTGLVFHSKYVSKGSIFFSIKGENEDGHRFIEEAVQNGAVAVVGDNEAHLHTLSLCYPLCSFIVVKDVRKSMAYLAKYYYNDVNEKLKTIGVTGTNGKTTVSAYVRSLLNLLGMPAGLIGTTGIWNSSNKLRYKKSTPTTPEAVDLHHIFDEFDKAGDVAASMEVSSIALDQKRVEGILFDVAIHTNFSEEHLEYHHTLENYKACKLKLFEQAKSAVINIDDDGMGEDILALFKGPRLTYSLNENSRADLTARQLSVAEDGSRFYLKYLGKEYPVYAPVYGTYNIANVLSAVGAALLLGYQINQILNALTYLQSPEGRFQVIQAPNHSKVILDYAHTPVALSRLVEEVKKLHHHRLIVMIAGIGIRDFRKMPKMASIIEGKADEIIVTVDHPGYHDPQLIIDQVMSGFSNPESPSIHTALTREEGVRKALILGQPDDIILLTSGCINNSQIIKGKEVPHSDEQIIQEHYLQSS
ncbi:UDP-N-acetylmuramoyl-L-alanyl-D-glutamate--2,6-diaminopimelate ligase [Halobacillus sp. B23F22_1]|uniref:UDP-N-acetylmuramoyl-L-alanyl-D-glutamate--2, 6-diaminopimelate ligase n=1 Tax=Halobacillus sp. B23F22_1 TaxID=3459514 RepID=UPI00373F6584